MSEIIDITAREIIDSRGNPTVEVDVYLSAGISARASAPSGASTGEREALDLKDNDRKRYGGKGVLKAIDNITRLIAPQLIGMDVLDQSGIDALINEIDGTLDKSNLGGNSTTAVSVACAKAAATFMGMPLYRYLGGAFALELPVPMLNIINGGKHADNNIDIQEFMIMPLGAPSFREAIRFSSETFHALKGILNSLKLNTGVGDEGGFAPDLKSDRQALDLIVKAIEKAGFKPGIDICIAIDAAASSFFSKGRYTLSAENKPKKTSDEMIRFYEELRANYPIVSIEDGLDENDWQGWKNLTHELGSKVQIVGDDLFCTNAKYLLEGIKTGAANSILIKVNQVGTLSETAKTINTARKAGYTAIISHRSGETEDTWIADLAVAFNTGQIKSGSMSRSERLAKYNQLLRIEEQLGDSALFRGREVLYSIG
jgi:enolase